MASAPLHHVIVPSKAGLMISPEFARAFADDWIASWNAHDLARILSHYSDDFSMSSPFIAVIAGELSGTLKGKDKVAAYWAKCLERMPTLKFEFVDVCASISSICLYYTNVSRGNLRAIEWFRFGPDGKVIESAGHYQTNPLIAGSKAVEFHTDPPNLHNL